jgi:hypothetical protein
LCAVFGFFAAPRSRICKHARNAKFPFYLS